MTTRNIIILGVLAIVVLLVGYYFLLLSPLLERLNQQAEAREAKQDQLAQIQQEVNELEQIRQNSPEIERQILELNKRIPAQPQIPTLIVQVEEIADASGVTQLTIDPEPAAPPAGGGDYQVVPVTMQFTGTYDEMQDFLLRTRNLARLVTVTDVSYCRNPPLDSEHSCDVEEASEGVVETTTLDPSAEVLLSVQINADVYFQPTDATSGESTTTVTETTTPEQPTEETTNGG